MKSKFYFTGFCIVFLSLFSAFGQAELTQRLLDYLNESTDQQMVSVRLQFPDTIDWLRNTERWDRASVPADERPKRVNRLLMRQAKYYQESVLEALEKEARLVYAEGFYLTNSIFITATASLIRECTQIEGVAYIDLATDSIKNIGFLPGRVTKAGSIQGTENGLKAIHAPQMWQLGYTGKGSTIFVFDSGVWGQHPAFSDRFLGNHRPMDQAWKGLFARYPTKTTTTEPTFAARQ